MKIGKPPNKERGYAKRMKEEMERIAESSDHFFLPFQPSELTDAMSHIKAGKACGLDGISAEMIQHLGEKTLSWLLELFSSCASSCKIPKRHSMSKHPENRENVTLMSQIFFILRQRFHTRPK